MYSGKNLVWTVKRMRWLALVATHLHLRGSLQISHTSSHGIFPDIAEQTSDDLGWNERKKKGKHILRKQNPTNLLYTDWNLFVFHLWCCRLAYTEEGTVASLPTKDRKPIPRQNKKQTKNKQPITSFPGKLNRAKRFRVSTSPTLNNLSSCRWPFHLKSNFCVIFSYDFLWCFCHCCIDFKSVLFVSKCVVREGRGWMTA